MSGLYLNPYRGYDGSPGNNPGGLLMIPHRSRYICSSNPLIEKKYEILNFIISFSINVNMKKIAIEKLARKKAS